MNSKTSASDAADPLAAIASSERLGLCVEQVPAAIAMFDRDMRYMFCSRRWFSQHGREEQSVVGRSHYEVFPEIPERWKEVHRRGMAGEVVRAEEDPFVRFDGRTQWLRWEVRPWLQGDGGVGGITIMAEDVTERVEAERALRENELRMRLAQRAAKVGTWEWWLADDRTEWSENLWSLYGLQSGQCPSSFEAWCASIHPDDRERVFETVREEAANGREYETQWRVNLPEGAPERWLAGRGSPVAGPDGAPERYIGVVIDITQQKQAEEALRKAEERERQQREELEAVLAVLPIAVVIAMDAHCSEMTGNRAAYELLRLPLHKSLSKSAPPERAPNNFDVFLNGRPLSIEELPIQKAAASKKPVSAEDLELRFVDGGSRIVNCNALPLLDAGGRVRGAVGVLTDITGFRRTEAALREAEELERQKREELEAILAAIPAPVLIAMDAGCENMVGNPAAYELYRVPPGANISKSAAVGKGPANFEIFQNGRRLPPEELPIRKAAAKQTFSGQEVELRFIEGDSKYLLGNALPLLNHAGEVRGAVAAFADVTELKRTEAALRETEARMQFALDAANAGTWEVDLTTGKIAASDRALSVLDFPPGTALTHELVLSRTHPDDLARLDESHRRTLETGKPYSLEWRSFRPDGSIRWLEMRGEPRSVAGRQVIAGLVLDITQRKRIEEALASARRREAVGQLAGGVAHDFNNLLHVIAANLELAQDFVLDDDTRELIRRAQSASEKGSVLTRRLLSHTRKRALKPECLSLNLRVEETAKLLQRTVGEHISVSTVFGGDLWPTLADPGEVDSAILNLVANSRDAMPHGGSIEIATSNVTLYASSDAKVNADARPGDYVCLAVTDDGPGMTEAVLGNATEPFFTTKGLGAGAGCGLTNVADFARQTGGFTSIESAPGKGCSVRVYLPRAAKEKELAEHVSTSESSTRGAKQLILIVEDDDDVCVMTRRRLEALGYAVIQAKTGPDAVEQLRSHESVRLVLSDIIMPGGLSGYDVARWVASNRPGVKVILCSGYNEGDRGEDDQEAADGVVVLAKPYTRDQLARSLNDALASH